MSLAACLLVAACLVATPTAFGQPADESGGEAPAAASNDDREEASSSGTEAVETAGDAAEESAAAEASDAVVESAAAEASDAVVESAAGEASDADEEGEAGAESATDGDDAEDEPTAEDLFTEGRNALFKADYEEAVKLLAQAVQADESKTSYRLHLARAYRYSGNVDEAARQLEKILESTADHVEAGQMLAEIYVGKKRFDDVVRVLEPLLEYRHDYPTYHMLAVAYDQLGKLDEAREHYEEAVKLNPESPTDYYQLGNLYLTENRFSLAAGAYRSALRLGLDSPVLRYKLASAYFNLRNYFGRIALQTVKSGKPGSIDGPWYLIEAVAGQDNVFRCAPESSAIYQLARAVADGLEERSEIRVLEATIYLNARRYDRAYDMFAAVEKDVPEADRALFNYYFAQAAFGTDQYDRYLELLEQAIALDPVAYESTLVDAYLQVADRFNQAGDLARYIEYLAKAVDQSPNTASLHLSLGNAYEENEQFELAVAQWQMVLDLEPDHPQRLELLNEIQRYRSTMTIGVADDARSGADTVDSPAP